MTNINIDLEKLIKEAFIEDFDYDHFVDAISTDICQSNPEWWQEKVVTPIKDVLIKTIKKNDTFIKEIIQGIVEEYVSEETIQDIAETEVRNRVRVALPEFEVKIKEK